MSINGFLSGNLLNMFDKIHPYETIININNLQKKDKLILIISCVPYYKLLVLTYVNTDPIIIQLLNSTRIGINPILYILYNKEYFLCNKIIIINIIINIFACIFPFIFNDNFSLKLTNIHFSFLGLIIIIISIILSSISNIINEKINYMYDFNNIYGCNTFITNTFMLIDMIYSIILIPFIGLIQYLIDKNLSSINNLFKIILISSIFGLLYGPYYIIVTKAYLKLDSVSVCIINNIILIITIFISCLLNLSIFYYLYIPSVILIIITSLILVYKLESLKNIVRQISITNYT
jgi:hypothetical protein